jgi:hypothetical protein
LSKGVSLQRAFDDKGKTGTATVGVVRDEEVETSTPRATEVNEFGEMERRIASDVQPHAFVSRGKTGYAPWHWGGGTGGKGNENTGDVALVAPQYDSEPPARPGEAAKAWVRSGTGTVNVTRSYTGVPVGANGTDIWGTGTLYITYRASRRMDRHELEHVTSSKSLHDTYLEPLEARLSRNRGKGSALEGTTPDLAETALKTAVNWNPALTSFATADTTANQPGGTTDTTDQLTPDFYSWWGPRQVAGVNYDNYVDTPPGPQP